ERAAALGLEHGAERRRLAGLAHVARARGAPRPIAERVEQRLELAGAAAARRELAIREQYVGRAVALAGGEPVPHDLAHARDLIHRAERAVIAGLPRETRADRDRRRARDELRGRGRQA